MHDITLFLQNHLGLSLAFLAVLVLLMIIEFIRLKRNSSSLTPMKAVQQINHHNAIVVDVRNSDTFAGGHIVDAISLPLNTIDEKNKKLEKFKSQPIIVVCATGLDSLAAAQKLQNLGFNVNILAGGLRAWRAADMPVVKG